MIAMRTVARAVQRCTPAPAVRKGPLPGFPPGDGRLAVQRNPDAGSGNLPLMQQALSAVNNDYSLVACMRWASMPGRWQIISHKCPGSGF